MQIKCYPSEEAYTAAYNAAYNPTPEFQQITDSSKKESGAPNIALITFFSIIGLTICSLYLVPIVFDRVTKQLRPSSQAGGGKKKR